MVHDWLVVLCFLLFFTCIIFSLCCCFFSLLNISVIKHDYKNKYLVTGGCQIIGTSKIVLNSRLIYYWAFWRFLWLKCMVLHCVSTMRSFVLYVLYKKILKRYYSFPVVFYLHEITLPDIIQRKCLVPITSFLTYEWKAWRNLGYITIPRSLIVPHE